MYKHVYDLGGIYLCPFDRKFYSNTRGRADVVSNYKSWWMNPETTKHNSHGLMQFSDDDFNDFFNSIDKKEKLVFAIIEKPVIERKGDLHIGNVSLQRFDWINHSAELAIIIGEGSAWGKGYGTYACRAVLYHGFMKMNFNRIWTGTAESNTGMNSVAKKIGMTHEGAFRDAMYLNGQYFSINEYGILKDEFIKLIQANPKRYESLK